MAFKLSLVSFTSVIVAFHSSCSLLLTGKQESSKSRHAKLKILKFQLREFHGQVSVHHGLYTQVQVFAKKPGFQML